MTTRLPPRPDATDGRPRPPAGPVVLGGPAQPTTRACKGGEPPGGRGPALEAHGADRVAVLGAAGLLTVVYVVALRSSEGNWTWLEDPVHWTLMGLIFVITVVRDWTTRLVAGSDWLRVNRRWVDTYALTDITLRGGVFGWMLRLRDSEGRRVRTYVTTIEANRQLWALAYNGMAHSVHHGARINNLAAGMLRLRPGLESLRREMYRPTIPTKSAGTLLLVIAAVLAAVSFFRPELLGPALAILAAAVLLVGSGIGTVLVMARRREDALDAQTFSAPDHHE